VKAGVKKQAARKKERWALMPKEALTKWKGRVMPEFEY
jgi:hypothetical protein